jgi:hypothetical protein
VISLNYRVINVQHSILNDINILYHNSESVFGQIFKTLTNSKRNLSLSGVQKATPDRQVI